MKWQNHIGLDIGSSTIKLVQLAQAGTGRFKLVALGEMEAPQFSDQGQYDNAVSEAVRKLVKDSRASTNQVAVSLPESLVYTRVVEMPALSEPDLSSTIRFQAEQYIPVPLADVVLKHQVLSMPEQNVPGAKMSVLLVAAPNEVLSRYSRLLATAGLATMAIETEILSVARAIVGSDPVTLLLHLGAEATTIAVLKDGLLVVVQSLATGSAAIIRSASSQLGLESRQTEEYVRSYGLDKTKLDGKVATAVAPVVEMIIAEAKRVIAFYQTRSTSLPVRRLVLTGGMALLPGLVAHFIEMIDLEVQLGNPFATIELSDLQKKEVGENAPIFAPAVGLALKAV